MLASSKQSNKNGIFSQRALSSLLVAAGDSTSYIHLIIAGFVARYAKRYFVFLLLPICSNNVDQLWT